MFSKKTICAGSCSFNGMRVQSSTLYRFVPAPPYRQICNLPEYKQTTGLQIRQNGF